MTTAAFVLIGVVGLFAHWLKKWLRAQTQANFVEYYFVAYTKHTAAVAVTFAVSMFGFVAQDPELTKASAFAAFSLGYLVDSAVNKD